MENSFYNMKMQKTGYIRTHFITLLGVNIASSLVPSVFEKIFSLEIVENDICLGGTSKQMPFFQQQQKNVPPENAPMPPIFRMFRPYIASKLSWSIHSYWFREITPCSDIEKEYRFLE